MTGRIRDIGQKVLQSAFKKEEVFVRNIIKLCINYIIYINDNNAVINNNYGRLQNLILRFKIPHGHAEGFLRNL